MNETKPLNPKQDSFCVHYTTIGAKTFGNGTKSAIAAGYSEKGAYVRGSELLRIRKVRERISELLTENMSRNNITTDSVLANIEHDRMLAREKGDISSAIRADELQGKHLAMFTDVQIQEPERKHKIDKNMAELAKQIANKVISSKPLSLPEETVASPSSVDKDKLTGLSVPKLPDVKAK